MSPGRWGKGKTLTFERARADNACMRLLPRHLRRARRDERGQALVEFALIAPLFFMLVIGVIQFAVALNFWFDMNRLANQGARSAAVNCGPATGNQCGSNLVSYLTQQVISSGDNPSVEVCYVPPTDPAPGGWTPSAGDAVRVRLKERYRLQSVVNLAKIDLTATATMRLEQDPASSALPVRTDAANWVLAAHASSGAACAP